MPDPATSQKQIDAALSSRQVTLSAEQTTATFEVTVYNDSDRFASFQVKVLAAGVSPTSTQPWYRLHPAVSSKIPAGDHTRFQVEIFGLPPIAKEFQGAIDLTVEVTSRELQGQYDRQSLRLVALGLQTPPPNLTLVIANLQAYPEDVVVIEAQIHNPTTSHLEALVRLSGLPAHWFPDGLQQSLSLLPNKPQKVTFEAQIPPPLQALSRVYPLQLDAIGRFPGVTTVGQLEILPAGSLSFFCEPLEAVIPDPPGFWQNPTQGTATFHLQIQNQSNLEPAMQFTVRQIKTRRRWIWQREFWQKSAAAETVPIPSDAPLPPFVTLEAIPTPLPLGSTTIPLHLHQRLPWLGWTRTHQFEVKAIAPQSPCPIAPDTQILKVHRLPVIPFWLQLLGSAVLIALVALLWSLLHDPGHRGPVNSVQFNGQGNEVLSGSDDQTIRRWRVNPPYLQTQTRIGGLEKAVRVVRYRPVNNDQMAIGFENGEMQLVNLLTGQRSPLSTEKDDRVFDLVFSRDARKLYSGHGSGLVLQWDIHQFPTVAPKLQRAYDTQFAIEAMTLTGNDDSYLVVGGRYNRLVIVETRQTESSQKTTSFLTLGAYPNGKSTDYITSLSTAEQQPTLLAIGDTQGRISLWDTQPCLQNRGNCQPLTPPWFGHSGSAVRSIKLTADGCFLASGGDDGQVKLWALDGQGSRRSSVQDGQVLGRSRVPINAVDVVQVGDRVWVTSGGDDRAVRLYSVRLMNGGQSVDQCPVLAGGN